MGVTRGGAVGVVKTVVVAMVASTGSAGVSMATVGRFVYF